MSNVEQLFKIMRDQRVNKNLEKYVAFQDNNGRKSRIFN